MLRKLRWKVMALVRYMERVQGTAIPPVSRMMGWSSLKISHRMSSMARMPLHGGMENFGSMWNNSRN